jgi:hypothetical protein
MASAANNPPANTPPIPPYWSNEEDWLVLIEFLPRYDADDHARGTDAIGYMFAYSQMTDTRMLALVGDPEADAYELLFSFSSADNKAEFLRLLQSNEATEYEGEEILVPQQDEIVAAQPIARVLPADVMWQVTLVAATFSVGFGPETVQ